MRLVYHCSLPPRTAFQQDEVTEPRKRGVGKGGSWAGALESCPSPNSIPPDHWGIQTVPESLPQANAKAGICSCEMVCGLREPRHSPLLLQPFRLWAPGWLCWVTTQKLAPGGLTPGSDWMPVVRALITSNKTNIY